MAFKIDFARPLASEVSRIGLEQTERARRSLAGHKDPATDIHNSRRALKRLRSLLRLIRPLVGDDTYRTENLRLRDIGRSLAGARDLHVMQQTCALVLEKLGADEGPARLALTEIAERLTTAVLDHEAAGVALPTARSVKALEATKPFWNRPWPKRQFGGRDATEALLTGLAHTYKKCRRTMTAAETRGDDEAFHEARKAMQHHSRHMSLLAPAWPEHFEARAEEARSVARLIGADHDLAVLAGFIAAQREAGLGAAKAAAARAVIEAEQARLRQAAAPRAARILALSSRALVRETAAILDGYQSLQTLPSKARAIA